MSQSMLLGPRNSHLTGERVPWEDVLSIVIEVEDFGCLRVQSESKFFIILLNSRRLSPLEIWRSGFDSKELVGSWRSGSLKVSCGSCLTRLEHRIFSCRIHQLERYAETVSF